jgi:hypothetical protein
VDGQRSGIAAVSQENNRHLMKKYIIRESGWAYNDSSYDREGMLQIAYAFADRNEAMDYLRFLNREYLCGNFYRIFDLEAGTPGMDRKEYLEGLSSLLVDEMGFNPTIRLPLRVDMTLHMFPEKPTDEQIDRIVDAFDLTFFRLVELPEEQTEFYYALLYQDHDTGYSEYMYDHHEGKQLFFASAYEALDQYRTSQMRYEWYRDKWMNLPADANGKWTELPAVLATLVEHSPFLRYEEGKLQLSYNSDTETLVQLNALLAKPLLVLEPVQLSEADHYTSVDIDGTMAYNEVSWKSMERRRAKYPTIEALRASEEYLMEFRCALSNYGSWTPYPEIIRKHVSRLTGTTVAQEMQLPYVSCVAISHKEVAGTHELTMHFGLDRNMKLTETPVTTGIGKDPEEAIAACLEDWFVKNEDLLRQKLLEIDLVK